MSNTRCPRCDGWLFFEAGVQTFTNGWGTMKRHEDCIKCSMCGRYRYLNEGASSPKGREDRLPFLVVEAVVAERSKRV